MQWLLKLDNSLLSRRSIERCSGRLCLYSDYFLYAVGCSLWGMDLATYVWGEYTRGLVVICTTAFIRLLRPSGTHDLNILACLGYIMELGASWLGYYA